MLNHGGHHDHESYVGDRTVEAIVEFAEKLIPAAAASGVQALPMVDAETAKQTMKVSAAPFVSRWLPE
eukprot:979801-Pyramimonas_sp.AAC.2